MVFQYFISVYVNGDIRCLDYDALTTMLHKVPCCWPKGLSKVVGRPGADSRRPVQPPHAYHSYNRERQYVHRTSRLPAILN